MGAGSDRVEVGRFVYEDGKVSGPAEYMKDQGFDRIAKIEAGNDVVFNYGVSSGSSPSPVVALLVSLQTDFAGWHGAKTLGIDGRS